MSFRSLVRKLKLTHPPKPKTIAEIEPTTQTDISTSQVRSINQIRRPLWQPLRGTFSRTKFPEDGLNANSDRTIFLIESILHRSPSLPLVYVAGSWSSILPIIHYPTQYIHWLADQSIQLQNLSLHLSITLSPPLLSSRPAKSPSTHTHTTRTRTRKIPYFGVRDTSTACTALPFAFL
jgi:hypothetical protein